MLSHTDVVGRTFLATRLQIPKMLAAVAAVFLTTAGAANAITVDMTYVVSYQATKGNAPTITGKFGSWNSSTKTGTYSNIGSGVGTGNPTWGPSGGVYDSSAPYPDFLWIAPSSSCGSNCVNSTAYGTLTVVFTFHDDLTGVTKTLTETGAYSAKYSGSYLGCSGKSGSGQSDCIIWSTVGASSTSSANGGSVTFNLDMSSSSYSDLLAVTLYNFEDWTLKPEINLSLTSAQKTPTITPLPGALPLFLSGTGLLGFLMWPRKKKRTPIGT